MNILEISKYPTVIDNNHESLYRSYQLLQYIIAMVSRDDSKETILDVYNNVWEYAEREDETTKELSTVPMMSTKQDVSYAHYYHNTADPLDFDEWIKVTPKHIKKYNKMVNKKDGVECITFEQWFRLYVLLKIAN